MVCINQVLWGTALKRDLLENVGWCRNTVRGCAKGWPSKDDWVLLIVLGEGARTVHQEL